MLVYLRDGYAQTILHAEIEVADQTFHFTQSQYTDTGPTSPSTDPYDAGRLTARPKRRLEHRRILNKKDDQRGNHV